MYATHITLTGTDFAMEEDLQGSPRSQRVPGELRVYMEDMVRQGLVSDTLGPNCYRRINEDAGNTTFCNATWVTQEAAQGFVDLYIATTASEYMVSATVVPV